MSELEILEPGQLSLFELADVANREHELCRASAASSLEHAWNAGRALLEAKAKVGHGGFLPWLEENFVATPQTARSYMTLARNGKRVFHLEETSIRGSLKALKAGDPQDKRREREDALRGARAEAEAEARASGLTHTLETADIREWRPNGVDSIVTDPPYIGDALPLYHALRDFAADVLPEGGPLVVMTWQAILPQVIHALTHPDLTYRWCICWRYANNENTVDHARRVFDCWKPILVYHKGGMPTDAPMIRDEIANTAPDKDFHEWGQSLPGFERLVNAFSNAGDTVCDPFLGGGTTAIAALSQARHFTGCDINPDAVEATRARLE